MKVRKTMMKNRLSMKKRAAKVERAEPQKKAHSQNLH